MDGVDSETLSDIGTSVNTDLDLNFDVDVDVDDFTIDKDTLALLEPIFELDSPGQQSGENSDSSRPYHTKRPHKKSRAGCQQCKKRKVKCDEARPACKACRLRREKCVYPAAPTSTSSTTRSKTDSVSPSPGPSLQSYHESNPMGMVLVEPQFRPRGATDAIDMKMLWFYTTQGYHFFSIQSGRSAVVDHVLQVKVVQHAFQSPFLMDCLMAVSSLQLQNMNQPIPPQRAAQYCAKAFEGYRTAIETANPRDFPALIACSLLMVAVSSEMFRDPAGKPLYIVDWMQVWHGISLIVAIVSPQVLQESGMAVLFYRPPVDLEKASSYIPNNLLFMVASIKPGDADEEHQQTYYDMLKYLGTLYQEIREQYATSRVLFSPFWLVERVDTSYLRSRCSRDVPKLPRPLKEVITDARCCSGFNDILNLRIITFFTFVPKTFVPLAKEHRPRALIILAHHLCFAKLTPDVWWMRGIADREIRQICLEVGNEWEHLLRVPQMVLRTNNKIEIAQLIINNRNWTPTEMDQYEKDHDPRVASLKLVNSQGSEVSIYHGQLRRKASITSTDFTDTELDSLVEGFPHSSSSVADTASNSS
ncbi:hypothetical protein F4677DRAFT_122077 [Hypoxylon crocopeplum]|nr:hypothetical protein F4677DRAFT_122077 [Hypoxylon crocopeplum]